MFDCGFRKVQFNGNFCQRKIEIPRISNLNDNDNDDEFINANVDAYTRLWIASYYLFD